MRRDEDHRQEIYTQGTNHNESPSGSLRTQVYIRSTSTLEIPRIGLLSSLIDAMSSLEKADEDSERGY